VLGKDFEEKPLFPTKQEAQKRQQGPTKQQPFSACQGGFGVQNDRISGRNSIVRVEN
jgi:hypothetical protein